MFGYIVANIDQLTPGEKQHYKSCYCGLCRSLANRHGSISRITVSYDMTFLVLLLSALYEKDCVLEAERCAAHPFRPHSYWYNEFTDYAADMNIVLTYFNCLDDWIDEKKVIPLCEAKLLEKKCRRIEEQYPDKCQLIRACLRELSHLENQGELNPDIPGNCFGKLMGEIFVIDADEHAGNLRAFGAALGKFIYIMDACLDLKADLRHERYNPMVASSSKNFATILSLLMADCTEKFQQLPIQQDKNLMENILYSGIWTRYELVNKKARRNISHGSRPV